MSDKASFGTPCESAGASSKQKKTVEVSLSALALSGWLINAGLLKPWCLPVFDVYEIELRHLVKSCQLKQSSCHGFICLVKRERSGATPNLQLGEEQHSVVSPEGRCPLIPYGFKRAFN